MNQNTTATQRHSVVCDNPTCDYKVVNTTGKVDLNDLKTYVNKPCPKCGENLLTEKDYKTAESLIKTIAWVDKYIGWIFRIFGGKRTEKVVSVKVHNGINVTPKN